MICTLADITKDHAESFPDKIALSDGVRQWSYRQLESDSCCIANFLKKTGVNPGDRVAVLEDKCGEMVAWAIGIWKCGAIYAPIDPYLPEKSLSQHLCQLDAECVVTSKEYSFLKTSSLIKLDPFMSLSSLDPLPHSYSLAPDDDAIIIHTSGSTGFPKGVVLQHASVVAYFSGHRKVLKQTVGSRCLNTASFHYDVSIQDTFLPLATGAYVRLWNGLFSPETVLRTIEQEKLTQITAVATVLGMITGSIDELYHYDLSSVECVVTGAEVCNLDLINAWVRRIKNGQVINGYGPSECNSVSVSYVIPEVDVNRKTYYPIGLPHDGVVAILVDEDLKKISKPNQSGQLLLGGRQLMKGYWRNTKATLDAFCVIEKTQYYKTGDLCHYDDCMRLVYDGRTDAEVKLHGRRINLNSISEVIENKTSCSGVLCGLVSRNGVGEIAVVLRDPKKTTALSDLIPIINNYIPEYMRPKRFGFCSLPVQKSSGKMDANYLFKCLEQAVNHHFESCFFWHNNQFVPYSHSGAEVCHDD